MTRGNVRRPGKDSGISGTVGMVTSRQNGHPLFYCFTSNGGVFEHEKPYDKFGVYTRLQHRGEFKAAARALGEMGYGEARESKVKIEPHGKSPESVAVNNRNLNAGRSSNRRFHHH